MMSKPIDALAVIRVVLVALMFAAGAVLYPWLPDMVPTHWGLEGQPDAFSSKIWGAWIMPLMSLVFLALFPLLPKMDPKRENYERFKGPWNVIQTSLVGFLAYVYGVSIYATFYPESGSFMGRAVMFGIGILFIILGNVMGKVRQNYFVGLKTPWTLDDPEVWQKSQRFAGRMFVLAGLAFIVESVVWFAVLPVFGAAIFAAAILPIAYSYLVSRGRK